MKLFESVDRYTDSLIRYTFALPTAAGESLVVDFTRCVSTDDKNDIAHMWHKHGFTSRVLPSYWHVNTYATDADGYCRGRYNPTIHADTHKLNFDWVLEATDENLITLLNEIMRLAGIRARIITRKEWEAFGFDDSFRPGDYVANDIIAELRDCLPPAWNASTLFQLGEPYSHEVDPETRKWRATYDTFVRVTRNDWRYVGHCFRGQTEEVA